MKKVALVIIVMTAAGMVSKTAFAGDANAVPVIGQEKVNQAKPGESAPLRIRPGHADAGPGLARAGMNKEFMEKVAKEDAKHRERIAKLDRIKELAVEDKDAATSERVDKVLEKENQRYMAKKRQILSEILGPRSGRTVMEGAKKDVNEVKAAERKN